LSQFPFLIVGKVRKELLKMYKVGDQVKVTVNSGDIKLKNAPGTIFYIDNPNLYNHMFSPIQVELDEPWTEHGQRMLRVSLRELKSIEETNREETSEHLGKETNDSSGSK
jgi:ribosomal protein L21E